MNYFDPKAAAERYSKGRLVNEESFKNPFAFSKKELALYFTTQSNITAAVESGTTSYAAPEAWLDKALSPFFSNDETRQTVYFGNWIKYIQRNG